MKRLIIITLLLFVVAFSFAQNASYQNVDVRNRLKVQNWIIYQGDTLGIFWINGDTLFTEIGYTLDTLVTNIIPTNYWTFVNSGTDTLKNNVSTTGVVAIKGNLELQTTNAAATNGIIKQNGANLIHTYHEKGDNNLFIGQGAGNFTLDSSYNIGIGKNALNDLTTGYRNIGIGGNAAGTITTGVNEIAIGYNALSSPTAGQQNIAIGTSSLLNCTGAQNVAVGSGTLAGQGSTSVTHDLNVAVGDGAGAGVITGATCNTFLGSSCGISNYTDLDGDTNTAVGAFSLVLIGSGSNNFAGGGGTLQWMHTGNNNTAIGAQAGMTNQAGNGNVFIGYQAGMNETGSNKLYIENSYADSTGALIWGDFSTNKLIFNGDLTVNGDITYGDTYWEDLIQPASGTRQGATTKPDFDYTDCGLAFPKNDSNEIAYIDYQLPHSWAGTGVYFHVHYLQKAAADTGIWCIRYRWCALNAAPGSWTRLVASDNTRYTYAAGTLHQISQFPKITLSGSVSSVLQVELKRIDNLGSGDIIMVSCDLHYERSKPGTDNDPGW